MSIEFYNQILDSIYDGVYFVDNNRTIIYWNKGAEKITGYTKEDVIGKACFDNILSHIDDDGNQMCSNGCFISNVIDKGDKVSGNIHFHHKQGYIVPVTTKVIPIYDNNGEVNGAVEIFSDRTIQVELENNLEQMRNIAMVCPLTKLNNRRSLESILKTKKYEMDRFNIHYGVVFLDIDNFKEINDKFGHDFGDEVLKILANLLKNNVRSKDTVGRWGGEEFMCIVSVKDEFSLNIISEKLRTTIENHVFLNEDKLSNVTISIGATIAKRNETIENVVSRADSLMYKSKNKGRNKVSIG